MVEETAGPQNRGTGILEQLPTERYRTFCARACTYFGSRCCTFWAILASIVLHDTVHLGQLGLIVLHDTIICFT